MPRVDLKMFPSQPTLLPNSTTNAFQMKTWSSTYRARRNQAPGGHGRPGSVQQDGPQCPEGAEATSNLFPVLFLIAHFL